MDGWGFVGVRKAADVRAHLCEDVVVRATGNLKKFVACGWLWACKSGLGPEVSIGARNSRRLSVIAA